MSKKKILRTAFTFVVLSLLLSFSSCNKKEHSFQKIDISSIEKKDVHIHRYEKELFSIDINNLKNEIVNLNPEYHFFLGENPDNDQNITRLKSYLQDSILIELYNTTVKKYPKVSSIEKDLSQAFRYYKHYFPSKKTPKIFSYVSGIDFRYPIQYYDSVIIIALDMYLGNDFAPYTQLRIPKYKCRTFTPEHILADCFLTIGEQAIPNEKAGASFLDKILHQGKILYFTDAMLPFVEDSIKIKYSTSQIEWCNNNEKTIWTYLIENDLLFSTDYSLTRKLLSDGPFTSDFGTNSAPRIGEWVGWQIIRSYMDKNPNTNLQKLINNTNSQIILQQSGYKP